MATKKKLLEAAAGSAGGASGLNVEEVFSTYLYDGNGSTQTITNGIDLDGEGGAVFIKTRSGPLPNQLMNVVDTERGDQVRLILDTSAEGPDTDFGTFLSNGFSLDGANQMNYSGNKHASWTFRKAPKFFDVVGPYTGNGTAGRTISHNLGSVPGCIIVKRTDTTGNWHVYHRGIDVNGDSAPETDQIYLNLTNAANDGIGYWNDTAPTSTEFTVGSNSGVNASGGTYVAYLFAHNNSDGEFGPTGDQDIIKCGSYTGNGQNYLSGGNTIDIGFEPQWIMIQPATVSGYGAYIYDTMRGIVDGNVAQDFHLQPSSSAAEAAYGARIAVKPTGFKLETSSGALNESGQTYIYIAIRRGPMAVPESATDVFAVDTRGGTSPTPPAFYLGAPVDLQVWRSDVTAANNWEARDRLRGLYGRLKLNLTDAEDSNGGNEFSFDQMLGQGSATGTNTNRYSWMWKRAPSFMDVVAYTGDGVAGRTVSHNLGVAPEMMWVKSRETAAGWMIYHKDVGATKYLQFTTSTPTTGSSTWNDTSPTSLDFTLGSFSFVNQASYNYVAYLFASLAGVSKVGSYTGNGSSNGDSQNIDCGFSSGARFVLIKRTDNTGNWLLFDTKRGIISGNDPALRVNSTGSNFNGYDFLEPNSNGFNVLYQDVSSSYNPNISGASYIFYAIA